MGRQEQYLKEERRSREKDKTKFIAKTATIERKQRKIQIKKERVKRIRDERKRDEVRKKRK